jgi:hypothetical protein
LNIPMPTLIGNVISDNTKSLASSIRFMFAP